MATVVEDLFPGHRFTCTVGATPVVGGTLVQLSAAFTVIPAAVDSLLVAGWVQDDGAVGDVITVWRQGIVRVTAGADVTFGQRLECAAAGTVKPAGVQADTVAWPALVGFALETFANGAVGRIALGL